MLGDPIPRILFIRSEKGSAHTNFKARTEEPEIDCLIDLSDSGPTQAQKTFLEIVITHQQ